MTIRITALCGSVRPDNATSRVLALAVDELKCYPGVEVTTVDLAELDLPLPGLPASSPEALERFQRLVEGSAGVLLASPEYHGGVSSPMKLAIDNLGFPSMLAGKPVVLLGVAAGAIGAIKSIEQLRGICAHVGALVLPGSVSVAEVHRVFDERGACLDGDMEGLVRGAAKALAEYIESAVCPRLRTEAAASQDAVPRAPDREASSRGADIPASSTHVSIDDARAEFERAWDQHGHTRIETDAMDVNQVLRESFDTDDKFRLTGQMLWDAEVRKAWDPATYIPGVILEGESWGRTSLAGGSPWFVRSSRQVAWKDGTAPGIVLEEVYLDPPGRSVLFFGRSTLLGPDGEPIEADAHQPLFHVEHAVAGTEDRPLSRWRIVHLTDTVDSRLIERQVERGSGGWLAGFLAAFVEIDLGQELRPLHAEPPVAQR